MNKIIPCLFLFSLMAGCYYDSEEYLYPQINNVCDTANVTYSGSVVPVLQSYCTSCHSGSNQVVLTSYNDVLFNVNNGKLLGSVLHTTGYRPMPEGGSKLDDCSIAKISIWINHGAPNN
jgi:hypothetical protein